MKLGERVGPYEIVTETTNQSGGNCVWAFAERDGKKWFIKEFLKPKYPLPDSPGSAASKKVREKNCERFEDRHRAVMSAIDPLAPGGGNLVTATDFFRSGSTYFKVTEPVVSLPPPRLHDLAPNDGALVLRTVALSLRLLHDKSIVHGDLKPSNTLFQRTGSSGLITAKLIDFDDSFFEGTAPPADQIGGDQVYASPEWFQYSRAGGDGAAPPARSHDIFSLGLLFHELLVGEGPSFDIHEFEGSVGLALVAGSPVHLNSSLSSPAYELIVAMLSGDRAARPTIDAVIASLRDDSICAKERSPGRPPEPSSMPLPEPTAGRRERSTISSTLGRRRGALASEPPGTPEHDPYPREPPTAPPKTSRVQTNFTRAKRPR